jgi:hypothetical protein
MTEVCIVGFKSFAGEVFCAKFLRRGIDLVAFNIWWHSIDRRNEAPRYWLAFRSKVWRRGATLKPF